MCAQDLFCPLARPDSDFPRSRVAVHDLHHFVLSVRERVDREADAHRSERYLLSLLNCHAVHRGLEVKLVQFDAHEAGRLLRVRGRSERRVFNQIFLRVDHAQLSEVLQLAPGHLVLLLKLRLVQPELLSDPLGDRWRLQRARRVRSRRRSNLVRWGRKILQRGPQHERFLLPQQSSRRRVKVLALGEAYFVAQLVELKTLCVFVIRLLNRKVIVFAEDFLNGLHLLGRFAQPLLPAPAVDHAELLRHREQLLPLRALYDVRRPDDDQIAPLGVDVVLRHRKALAHHVVDPVVERQRTRAALRTYDLLYVQRTRLHSSVQHEDQSCEERPEPVTFELLILFLLLRLQILLIGASPRVAFTLLSCSYSVRNRNGNYSVRTDNYM